MIRLITGTVLAVATVAAAVAMNPGCNTPSTESDTRDNTVTENEANPVVIIETSMGTIRAELWADKAPVTVANFLTYADEKFFDGLIFHRVIKGFMIQGGGFDADMKQKTCHDPIKNEASADKKNLRGTLAMARTNVVDSATAQFFINVVDNTATGLNNLDHRDNSPQGFGYCAFGKVIEGLDVVDKIRAVATGRVGPYDDVPTEPVTIISIRRAG